MPQLKPRAAERRAAGRVKPMDDSTNDDALTAEPLLELDDQLHLQEWANKDSCALLAFIAPYVAMRLNPASEAYASIGFHEEFGIESFLEKCQHANVKKLHLLVNSPGGGVVS